jgi:hypothetical protein
MTQWIGTQSIVHCYLTGRIASPVRAYVITITIFYGIQVSGFSEGIYRCEDAIVWRIGFHLVEKG